MPIRQTTREPFAHKITVCIAGWRKGSDCQPAPELITRLPEAMDKVGQVTTAPFQNSGVARMVGCDQRYAVRQDGWCSASWHPGKFRYATHSHGPAAVLFLGQLEGSIQ